MWGWIEAPRNSDSFEKWHVTLSSLFPPKNELALDFGTKTEQTGMRQVPAWNSELLKVMVKGLP